MSTKTVLSGRPLVWCVVIGVALLLPGVAHAQSAIAGLVTDSTGAAMPGVTVEAASPALIEGVRSVTTDGQGRYTIDDLRPGVYKVTFTLPGFSTSIREGIELSANFTAPINAQLRVGAVEESVTVTGASPLVDVQRTASQQTLTREVLDTLPTGRNAWNVGVMLPGMTVSPSSGTGTTADVGGLGGTQQQYLSMHGSKTGDGHFEIDGMNVTCISTSSQCVYLDDGAFQELTYQTVGGTAESQLSGVIVNMIPKDGGNTFKGSALAVYANSDMYSSNYTDELAAQGLKFPGSLVKIWDYNPNLGGPILKDRLWFFASLRVWGTDKLIPVTFDEPGVEPTRQYSYPSYLRSYLGRVTGQVNSKNKIATLFTWMPRDRPRLHNSGGAFTPGVHESALLQAYNKVPYVAEVKWTSPITSQNLLEVGWSRNIDYYDTYYADTTAPGTILKMDTVLGTRWNAGTGISRSRLGPYEHVTGKWSYVTGSHSMKAGTVYSWGQSGGGLSEINGDIYLQYRNGVPFQVQVHNTPTQSITKLNREISLFVQDSWTFGRITANGGLRYDYLNAEVPAQSAPAGTFVPERHFEGFFAVPTWHNWSPRVGIAWDLFGTGMTAIKGSWGQYIAQSGTGLAGRYNPMGGQSDLRTWTPANNPTGQVTIGTPPLSEIGPPRNSQFGLVSNRRRPGPDLGREQNQVFNVSVQHQLFAGTSVSAGFYTRRYYNLLWTDNVLTTFDDYTLINIPNPYRPGTTVPVYNLNRNKLGLVDEVDFMSRSNKEAYKGFDVTVNVRLAQGANLLAGMSSGLSRTTACEVDDPNALQYCDKTEYDIPMNKQFKLSGSYTIPKVGVSASAVIQSTPGNPRALTYVVSRAVVPTLTLSSVTVGLNEPGTLYLPRLNMMDLRFSKNFSYRGVRIQPQVAVFNLTNQATILLRNNSFGPSLDQVQQILDGRFVRLGVQVDF